MKAHPNCEFFIFDGQVYYNSIPVQSGAFSDNVLSVSGGTGYLSLYEYNIDKSSGQGMSGQYAKGFNSKHGNHFSYPYVVKDSSLVAFKRIGTETLTKTDFQTNFDTNDVITGSYPMSASIVRELWTPVGAAGVGAGDQVNCARTSSTGRVEEKWKCTPEYPHYWALKNRLNYYGIISEHYKVTGSSKGSTFQWIKDQQTINFISIPSIFYGSGIKPGSLSLKWYFTGTLIGELQDTKQNGELIQLTGNNPDINQYGSDDVAGVVLYDEGFILLTGSWALTAGDATSKLPIVAGSAVAKTPSWIYFGAGTRDGVTQASTAANFNKASFNLSFKGTTETQVVTMFAHARRGEANYSNNPTYLEYRQQEKTVDEYGRGGLQLKLTSSQVYEERSDRRIKNIVSSSYTDYSASFKRQVYISRVAVYDDSKNLIGVATLSNPVLKDENEDLAFKIRLDI